MIGRVAGYCLVGEKGAATVRKICQNLREAVSKHETYAFHHTELLKAVLEVQPFATLSALCGDDAEDLKLGMRILEESSPVRRNAFDAVPEAALIRWCDEKPETRYPAAAAALTAFEPSGQPGRLQWTGTSRKLLDKAPNRVEVLKQFTRRFSPSGWAGSRASIVESNAMLLDDLANYPDPAVVKFIVEEKARLATVIKVEKQIETTFMREVDERFE
jgi:hypothetical protein